jgi:hypothetical protein
MSSIVHSALTSMPFDNLEPRLDPSVFATNMELPFLLWHDEKVTGHLPIYPSVND